MAVSTVRNESQSICDFMGLIARKRIVRASSKEDIEKAVGKIFRAISTWFRARKKAEEIPSKGQITSTVTQIGSMVEDNFEFVLEKGLLSSKYSLSRSMLKKIRSEISRILKKEEILEEKLKTEVRQDYRLKLNLVRKRGALLYQLYESIGRLY